MNYWIFQCGDGEGALIDLLPDHCPEEWRFDEGESLSREFPSEVHRIF